ncbi:HigA family addiction module antitoxin [Pilimelia columellifera]|uniref:HigA family addiction module antitoxin n=1 Tax=Pilimelia columellifera subsp. columellifera TaxID=706583 RepID=A0ABP6ACK1_9ACTN
MTEKAHPPITPGEILLEDFLVPMGISQYRLATAMGVPPRRINEIVHGTRRITPDTALRMSKALGLSERYWLNIQADYDIEVEKENHGADIDAISPLAA